MKTRELKCSTCGEYWEEPVRPGARPWECPACNPKAAARREAERERAAKRTAGDLDSPAIEVPYFMRDVVERAVRMAADFPQPGREELAAQVRAVAAAQGHLQLREELQRLAALCLTWSAWLPVTAKVPDADSALA